MAEQKMSIDIVIPWVDGTDPEHVAKRSQHLEGASVPLAPDAVHRRRWSNTDELQICLRSIELHAPWVRYVWIITDDQRPTLDFLSAGLAERLRIVDHRYVFRGHEHILPSFNSLSIGTASWRIDGLADRYIYFNDDTFLFRSVAPTDFFHDDSIVLRGAWESLPKTDSDQYLTKTYRFNKVEAAKRLGFEGRFFSLAHVAQPLDRRMLAELFDRHPDWFANNIKARFRSNAQFSISSLMAHLAIAQKRALVRRRRDWRNFSSRWCQDVSAPRARLELLLNHIVGTKLICVNDLAGIEERCPGFRQLLIETIERT